MSALTDALMQQKAASSESFMQENAARAEVTTTESGLQYEVLVEGTGPKPSATDTVVTHYHGTLTDGTVFDSSVERGSPATFPVNRVIAGWTEALQMMGTGSKWRLVIPSELAYGERGAGGAIPPDATLVFEVELLEIQ
jgi:FKBP-type peptidyl-prolyl cis-trans isomerase FklB